MPSKPRGKKAATTATTAVSATTRMMPLVGHRAVRDQLSQAIAQHRLGHAYLFVGPAGVGKRRLALHLAQSLLCETGQARDLMPCGDCSACRLVLAGSHPDVSTFGKPADKNELPIAVVQELVAQLALKPAFGRYKVVILDDADDLNEESANSFLKTLEEPPPTTVLILLATSQETQLPTIQSRCQIIRFQPLSLREVADVLLGLSVTASAAVAGEWAADSEGSVAQALEWSRSEWREFTSRFSAGLFGRDLANPAFVDQVLTFIDEAGKESSAKRHRARQVLRWSARELLLALRSACVQSTGDDAADVLADMIERTLDAEYHVARMAGVPLAMETWLDDLMRLRQGNYVAAIR